MGLKKTFKKAKKTVKKVVNTVAPIASVIPGPWQVPALAYKSGSAALDGDMIGALAYGVGAYGAGGGFSSGGFNSQTLTNPGGMFSSAIPTDYSSLYADGLGGVDVSGGFQYTPSGFDYTGMTPMTGGDYATNYDSLYADGLGGVDTSGGFQWQDGSALTNGLIANGVNTLTGATPATVPWYQSLLSNGATNGLLSSALQIGGGALAGNAAVNAAQTSADAQIRAAQIAADAAKFRPVGITTNFGSSNFTKDAQGNVTGAGYTLSPEMLAQQAKLMGVSEQALQQYMGSIDATKPMGEAASRMMTLGNSYLATTPQEQAAKYMAEQQALLATGRERDVNNMLTGEYNRGTYGLSTGGTSTGMNAANPRLEAMFNAQRQQDLGLAAQATQGGMDYAKFGAGMVGGGGDMLKSMYGVQSAAYDPYRTALGGATQIEGLGQNALTLGMDMGNTVTAANARSGTLLANGMTNAATTMQPANAYSPWGAMLTGAGQQINAYNNPNPTYDPRQFRLVPYGQ